MLLKQKVHNQA